MSLHTSSHSTQDSSSPWNPEYFYKTMIALTDQAYKHAVQHTTNYNITILNYPRRPPTIHGESIENPRQGNTTVPDPTAPHTTDSPENPTEDDLHIEHDVQPNVQSTVQVETSQTEIQPERQDTPRMHLNQSIQDLVNSIVREVRDNPPQTHIAGTDTYDILLNESNLDLDQLIDPNESIQTLEDIPLSVLEPETTVTSSSPENHTDNSAEVPVIGTPQPPRHPPPLASRSSTSVASSISNTSRPDHPQYSRLSTISALEGLDTAPTRRSTPRRIQVHNTTSSIPQQAPRPPTRQAPTRQAPTRPHLSSTASVPRVTVHPRLGSIV